MRHRILLLAAVQLIFACQDQGNDNQTANTAGGKAAGNTLSLAPGESATFVDGAAAFFQPGQWEASIEVAAGPGAGEPQPPPTAACLAADQAQRPGPSFLLGRNDDESCTYLRFSMEGDRIYATIQCGGGAGAAHFIAAGQFTPTSFELRTRAQASGQGVTFDNDLRVTARRIGDCPG